MAPTELGARAAERSALIESLRRRQVLKTEEVIRVFELVDRALYVDQAATAYLDQPQSIGYQVTISAPHMHAIALELMAPYLKRPGSRALDIGSGSGYLTACMAHLSQGTVLGLEHIPQLVSKGLHNVGRDAASAALLLAPEKGQQPAKLRFLLGDGRLGYPEAAPYDIIHVGAAMATVPEALLAQLRPGGALLAPIGDHRSGQLFSLIVKDAKSSALSTRTFMAVSYVPLTSAAEQLGGR